MLGWVRFSDALSPGVLALTLGILVAASMGYVEQPPLAHTGGFGEPTCHRCHFAHPLDAPGGALTLGGVAETYTAGQHYTLTIELRKAGMKRGGFQLAARFASGSNAGQQAGVLRATNERAETVRVDSTGVQYARHTKLGTTLAVPDSARWRLDWTAPDSLVAPVVFHLAANAANDDASEFGDFIYTQELHLDPE